ncbi:MAG: DJ-1/PfpI family protein [Deltaproteobacteria bacterium]|nr:DJ-1/PfpI family protein [Deltaproteobacteria bacterium]
MTKSVLIPIADGNEEIEVVTLVDVLRRAGLNVTLASVSQKTILGAHKLAIGADQLIAECEANTYDGIFLPGGMPGASNLEQSAVLISMLKKQASAGKLYGALCASPAVALAPHGLLKGKKSTTYPGFESKLPDQTEASKPVVVDGNCITGQSPGTAQAFALAIVQAMLGEEQAKKIKQDLC